MKTFVLAIRKTALFFIFSLCIYHHTWAQDPHFSQNYATPLMLNPALTGLMSGDVRATAVYRNQGSAVSAGSAFRTITASADMSFQNRQSNDRVAIGVLFYNDRAGDVAFSTNYLDVALAYNLGVGEHSYLSLGVQSGVFNRNLDLSKAQFGDEFDGNINQGTSGDLAIIDNTSIWRLNLGGGLMYYWAPDSRTNMYLGGGLYHLTSPSISVTSADDVRDKLSSKISVQAGGSLPMGDYFDLQPSLYYLQQGKHAKIDAGTFFRFIINRDRRSQLEKAFSIGAFTRFASSLNSAFGFNDIILAAKLDYNNISIGASYDITFSDFNAANNNRGGFEISLTFLTQRQERSKMMHCPRF